MIHTYTIFRALCLPENWVYGPVFLYFPLAWVRFGDEPFSLPLAALRCISFTQKFSLLTYKKAEPCGPSVQTVQFLSLSNPTCLPLPTHIHNHPCLLEHYTFHLVCIWWCANAGADMAEIQHRDFAKVSVTVAQEINRIGKTKNAGCLSQL